MSTFDDPAAVARYLEGPVAKVPGFLALHRMCELLLAERVADDGRVLVLGAGGGLELRAFAAARPRWRLVGVDPSAPMLALARDTLGTLAPRVELIEGDIHAAPEVAFDGATCLLTLHFLSREARLQTLRGILQRLRAGAPLVVAHHSFDATDEGKARWLGRYAAFASPPGASDHRADANIAAMGRRLPILSPEAEVGLLAQAGFQDIELFYAGFSFRGWVAYRP